MLILYHRKLAPAILIIPAPNPVQLTFTHISQGRIWSDSTGYTQNMAPVMAAATGENHPDLALVSGDTYPGFCHDACCYRSHISILGRPIALDCPSEFVGKG
jgi:hypothetical protein